ncbi:2-dehydropantoate 2-reductase [Pedobacter sp. KR3-3]|uniref:2-dehydropantoate 2-reductase n=1 Tax=Pedobacter albus TaxID=3113905 RepID=A0ABU7I267_9SPHI|nr:2-dehydropantoate 2-reductase [Pedobacter sp. KR3-3]MEE1943538.1 2-dehydropantoate 2-reductase [Pedobacter sp. KR3-3]
MTDQTKIVIAGIGGVGGYFGGLLAKKYANSAIQVSFIARGQHLEQIRERGLTVIKGEESFIAQPYLATDKANEIGLADYVLICTKNYDLDTIIAQLKPCIGPQTLILPLLNGIEGAEKIRTLLPQTTVASGCVYIVSAIKEPGVVENIGHQQKLFFGIEQVTDERLTKLEHLLQEAGIEATLTTTISKIIWQKFIFLSSLATATSYFDQPVGQLLQTNRETLAQLITEVTTLAKAKGIAVDAAIMDKSMAHYESLPDTATSSMHRDFMANKQTELESLTGYVVKQGQLLGLDLPTFEKAFAGLSSK